jgi:hypothetical protein
VRQRNLAELHIRLDPAEVQAVKDHALKIERSTQWVLRSWIREKLKKIRKVKP